MSLSDLKPCPFCGCDGWIVEDRSAPPLLYRPQCKMCGGGLGGFQYRDNAIMVWNTRAEGVAALQQAGWRPMADAHKNGEPILALTISQFPGRPDLDHWRNKQIVVHHRGLAPDGFDIGWSMNAPVGHGGFPDDWFVGWAPLPQQTALVEEGVEIAAFLIEQEDEPLAADLGTRMNYWRDKCITAGQRLDPKRWVR